MKNPLRMVMTENKEIYYTNIHDLKVVRLVVMSRSVRQPKISCGSQSVKKGPNETSRTSNHTDKLEISITLQRSSKILL